MDGDLLGKIVKFRRETEINIRRDAISFNMFISYQGPLY